MKPLHISRAVFDVTVCEIRGVRLRVPLRARASACTSEWHSSPPLHRHYTPTRCLPLPRLAGCPWPSICTSDQVVSNRGLDKQVWLLLKGAFWCNVGDGDTRASICGQVCVCVCVPRRISPTCSALSGLSVVSQACSSPANLSESGPCSDPPAKTDQNDRLPATDAFLSLLFHYRLRLTRSMDQLWKYLVQPSSRTHFRQANAFKSSAIVTILAFKRVKIMSFTTNFGCWGLHRLGLRNRSSMKPSYTFSLRFFYTIEKVYFSRFEESCNPF